jgi:acyl-CoA synthetase (AMP-forming)/AMP-acid ligase II
MDNRPKTLEVAWAMQRSGLYYTPISTHASPEEATFIINDCGADTLIASAALARLALATVEHTPRIRRRYAVYGEIPGFDPYDDVLASARDDPLRHEREGRPMVYSSGSTGRPKSVKVPLPKEPMGTMNPSFLMETYLGMDHSTVFLSIAPLYHGAPFFYAMGTQRLGGTLILPPRFDAAAALRAIEAHEVTGSYMVPTMFVRFLKLPDDERSAFDTTTLQSVVHSGGPCPVHVKLRMLEWWGPVLYEFYAGTERNGMTFIGPQEWYEHPGSVGKALIGEIRITDPDGVVMPPSTPGTVWFAGGLSFEYHNDAAATAAAHNDRGWSTLGDVGFVDDDGYLTLTDRRQFLIVSGGVNIAPREIEDVLLEHPAVVDAAVFGIPNEEFGEEVKAVVEAVAERRSDETLREALIAFCRERLSHVKCPRSIDVVASMPRTDAGKLRKNELRAPYWEGHDSFIR